MAKVSAPKMIDYCASSYRRIDGVLVAIVDFEVLARRIDAALKDRDERAAKIAEHKVARLAEVGISEGNWHELDEIAVAIRGEE